MKLDPRTVFSHAFNPSAPDVRRTRDLEKLKKSCQEFEAIMLQQMYKSMRQAVPKSDLFEKDMATDLYQEMFDAEVAKETAKGQGVGIAKAMYQQLAEMVENKRYTE